MDRPSGPTALGLEESLEPDSSPQLSLVVPVYNELEILGALHERVAASLDALGRTWELLLVDDGSSDGSGPRMDEIAAEDPRVRILHFEHNCGQSAALVAGFQASRGDLVAMIDADLQTYPEDLGLLIDELERQGVEAAVGIRAERHDSMWKRISSLVANGVRNRLTREEIADTGCPLKVFRGEVIRALQPVFNGAHRFLPTLLRLQGATVVQIPVRHTHRTTGRSKYGTLDRAFRGLRDALGVRWLQDRAIRWRLK